MEAGRNRSATLHSAGVGRGARRGSREARRLRAGGEVRRRDEPPPDAVRRDVEHRPGGQRAVDLPRDLIDSVL